MNRLATGLAAIAFFLVSSLQSLVSRADVPRLIHFQGRLTNSEGAFLPGSVNLWIRLYDHPSNSTPVLFDESHIAVSLSSGLFSIFIGSQTGGGVPDAAVPGADVFLGVSVNGDAELSPRTRVATAPFALLSTSGGLLSPRMTTAQRNAVASPVPGLQIFNTTTNCLEFFVGGFWQKVACGCSDPPTMPDPIEGPAVVDPNSTSVAYSISSVFGAESYLWSVPPDATIVSGQGTPSISVDFGSTSGNIVVNAVNACGSSPDRILTVAVASQSCLAIKTANPSATSGVYTIDPDGQGADAPFSVYCEMTLDGGGWTLVGTRNNTTTVSSESQYGTALDNPDPNADNMYMGTWDNLGFTTVLYELNNYATDYYFENINTTELRNYARTALNTARSNQTYRPDCRTALGGGTVYTICGGIDGGCHGWVFDPAGSHCWWSYSGYGGVGSCAGSGGTRGRVWVR